MCNRKRIAVDLTPLTKSSKMGGGKVLVMELLRSLAAEDSSFDYILLTNADSHDELAELDAANVSRVCVKSDTVSSPNKRIKQTIHIWVNTIFPYRVRKQVKHVYHRFFSAESSKGLLHDLNIDLLFCPFTGPLYHAPRIPTVSVVYDLQFREHPGYFSRLELMYLEEHFREACEVSEHLITGSEFVKQSILRDSRAKGGITVVYDSVHSRLADIKIPDQINILSQLGLVENEYLFFPAKYWPHKNHLNALRAFRQYHDRSASQLKLVFSGIDRAHWAELDKLAAEMGVADRVVLLDWVPEQELAVLYRDCRALFFPSRYEGFGIPILEAFQFGKPVLCSNAASLPEVAGEAALYFDPDDIEQMAHQISKLENAPALAAELVELGRGRLAKFPDSRGMAAQYEEVFREVLRGN